MDNTLAIELKVKVDNIVFGYGDYLDDYRKYCISAKNLLNDIIEDTFKTRYVPDLLDAGTLAISPNNVRYVKCVSCGRIDSTSEFTIYGGVDQQAQGFCRECARKKERGVLDEKSYKRYLNYMHYPNDDTYKPAG